MDRPKTSKNPNCKLCDKKRRHNSPLHFLETLPKILQMCNTKKNIHLYNYISASTLSYIILPSKTKKLALILTITVLNHRKTQNRLQFEDSIIPTTNTLLNIENDPKNIIQRYRKQQVINNTVLEKKLI